MSFSTDHHTSGAFAESDIESVQEVGIHRACQGVSHGDKCKSKTALLRSGVEQAASKADAREYPKMSQYYITDYSNIMSMQREAETIRVKLVQLIPYLHQLHNQLVQVRRNEGVRAGMSLEAEICQLDAQKIGLQNRLGWLANRIKVSENIIKNMSEMTKGMVSEAGLIKVEAVYPDRRARSCEKFHEYLMTKWYSIDGKRYDETRVFKVASALATRADIDNARTKDGIVFVSLDQAKHTFLSDRALNEELCKKHKQNDKIPVSKIPISTADGIIQHTDLISIQAAVRIPKSTVVLHKLTKEIIVDNIAHNITAEYYIDTSKSGHMRTTHTLDTGVTIDVYSMERAQAHFLSSGIDEASLKAIVNRKHHKVDLMAELMHRFTAQEAAKKVTIRR